MSSPRYMVTVLPGRCRGAALEVEELSDKHVSSSIVEQGALLWLCNGTFPAVGNALHI